MTDLILALDQGTTSSRSILFTEKAEIRAVASEPLECHYPDSGWVEPVSYTHLTLPTTWQV